jgi:hypothetical protein
MLPFTIMKSYAGLCVGLLIVSLCGCRTQGTHVSQKAAPASAVPVTAFAIPVGMLPVNVVGSYGGGTAFAKRVGAGQHPLPSGVGIPVRGSSPKQNTWTCMVLVYGKGAAVQYEGMGHCGVGKQAVGVENAVCQIALPNGEAARSGIMGVGWCTPVSKRHKNILRAKNN